jgi:hypothetical protein
MSIEKELLKATGFEPKRKYPDRQNYLAALARATNQLEDKEFEALSEAAIDWFNAAAKAIGNKRDIEEFEAFPETGVPGDVTEDDAELEAAVAEADEDEAEAEVEKRVPKDVSPGLGKRFYKKPPPKALKVPSTDDDIQDVELDKFACIPGTKNAQAASLFEGGARMSDVTKTLGGTYYNLLARLVKQGHKVEKGLHGIILLTYNPEALVTAKSKYTAKTE